MAQPNVKKQAKCPACGATLTFTSGLKLNKAVVCSECDAELEVASVEPLVLDWAFDDDEDYDYDADDDYDYDDDDEYEFDDDDDYDYENE